MSFHALPSWLTSIWQTLCHVRSDISPWAQHEVPFWEHDVHGRSIVSVEKKTQPYYRLVHLIMYSAFPIPVLALAHHPLIGAARRLAPRFAGRHNSRKLSTIEFSTAAHHLGAIAAALSVVAVVLWRSRTSAVERTSLTIRPCSIGRAASGTSASCTFVQRHLYA